MPLTFLVTETGAHLVTEGGAHLVVERTPAPAPTQGGAGGGSRRRRRVRPYQAPLLPRPKVLPLSATIAGSGGIEPCELRGVTKAELAARLAAENSAAPAPADSASARAQVFCPYVNKLVGPEVAQHNQDFVALCDL
jgi:hypothetical protein